MEDEESWNTVQLRPAKQWQPPPLGRGTARLSGAAVAAESVTASGGRIRGGPGVVFSSSHGFMSVTVDEPAPAWVPGGGGEQQVRVT